VLKFKRKFRRQKVNTAVFRTKKTVNTVTIPQGLYFSLNSCRSHVKRFSPCKPASVIWYRNVYRACCKLLKHFASSLAKHRVRNYSQLSLRYRDFLFHWRRFREEGFRQEVLSDQICEVSATLTGLFLKTAYDADSISLRVLTLPCETAPKAVLLVKLVSMCGCLRIGSSVGKSGSLSEWVRQAVSQSEICLGCKLYSQWTSAGVCITV
jgi:hypothetical protein